MKTEKDSINKKTAEVRRKKMNSKIRVVIASGNRTLGELAEKELKSSQSITVEALVSTGKELIERVSRGDIDAVLTEFVLPDTDGNLMIGRIKELQLKRQPVYFFIDAFCCRELDEAAAGIKYFTVKPAELASLASKVEKYALPYSGEVPKKVSIAAGVRLRTETDDILHRIGVPEYMKGYLFLKEAAEETEKSLMPANHVCSLSPQLVEVCSN